MQAGESGADRVERVQVCLGYRFRDVAWLETALTHRSYIHETGVGARASYERLEFLGDALLGLLVSDWLYRDDESAAEGVLSRRRQAVVRTSTLAAVAVRLGLGQAIRLSRGEEQTGGRQKTSLLADAFESVLGAIYLDGGIRAARTFLRRELRSVLHATRGSALTSDDFKTRLQEAVQARLQQIPRYRIVSTTGPDHALEFTVEVWVGDRALGQGRGSSRKQAEQEAAGRALRRWVGEGD